MSNTELIHYCKALEQGFTTECASCPDCDYSWHGGYGHHEKCPRCHPDQPKPLAEQLTDMDTWPGHEFVFALDRGPRGRWVLLEHYRTVRIADMRALAALMPDGSQHIEFLAGVRHEIERLQGELVVTEELLETRNALLGLFTCSVHGDGCVPGAIEDVKRMKRICENVGSCRCGDDQ
jgi:hypothetical protein